MQAQHVNDIVATLRTQNIIVQAHVGRYVGVSGVEYIRGMENPQDTFVRANKGKLSTPREAQAFINDESLKALDLAPQIDPYGGTTEVHLIDVESGAIMGSGDSKCHNNDKFNRSLGFKKALRRALNSAKLDNVKFK